MSWDDSEDDDEILDDDEIEEMIGELYDEIADHFFEVQGFKRTTPKPDEDDIYVKHQHKEGTGCGAFIIIHQDEIVAQVEASVTYDKEEDTLGWVVEAVHIRKSVDVNRLAALLGGLNIAFSVAAGWGDSSEPSDGE